MKHGVVYTAGVDAEAGRKPIEDPFIVGAYEHPLSDHRRVGTLAESLGFVWCRQSGSLPLWVTAQVVLM